MLIHLVTAIVDDLHFAFSTIQVIIYQHKPQEQGSFKLLMSSILAKNLCSRRQSRHNAQELVNLV